MQESAMYFGKNEIYEKIRAVGGQWNDSKDRPLVCLIESTEYQGIYWAIPVGNWNHRDESGQKRIQQYISYPDNDLRSCYYHVGKTNIRSIFFISDVIPITKEYIEREYIGFGGNPYVIKNPKLLEALTKKLKRILAFESSKRNAFRQRITDVKHNLIQELEQRKIEEVATVEETKTPVQLHIAPTEIGTTKAPIE
ncbi:hypothetical protein [Desulfosporosinus sp. BG]|uniref:hypothetical protein n=1 Tax=Desulfosporosinus sp. BG TaxID=1633135 RepID=UPI00083A5371|nr:hypothetical protein [Desulfosporosinus sp. BG]ODA40636.1 hypothetical protein DSBG_2533 [Desulfosporosinus sp. BG]